MIHPTQPDIGATTQAPFIVNVKKSALAGHDSFHPNADTQIAQMLHALVVLFPYTG